MAVIRGLVVNSLCLVLAGALVSLPVSARAATPADVAVAKLVELGVDPGEAQAQVATLDDAEIELLAESAQTLPAGADSDTADVVIAFFVIAGIVFITLVITDAIGVTDVFPWVKKAR